MGQASVAVVIPCWNAEKWVAEAIQSALDQDHEPLEVIVIDDGSTDGSLDVIRSFGDRIRWEAGPNRGAPTARNRGLALTDAEFVLFLDADDKLIPGAVSKLVERSLDLSQDAREVVFGNVVLTDGAGNPTWTGNYTWFGDDERASPVWIALDGPRTAAVLHRRSYLLEICGFTEGRQAGQEWDLHVRLSENGVWFRCCETPVYYYRQHDTPTRISNRRASRRSWADPVVISRILTEQNYSFTARERVMVAKYLWSRGRRALREGDDDWRVILELAKEASPSDHVEGGRFYKLACMTAGPAVAEWADNLKTAFMQRVASFSAPVST